jgi:choline dehydrogenase-like flavoprotein
MRTEQTDVCVIGSGAGGSVVAHEAARRGRQTLIVERGPYVRGRDMSHDEVRMVARLYKDGGLQLNTTMDMFILQGSCVGGSTVLANNAMFRVGDDILDDWARLGAVIDRAQLGRSFDRIERTLGARPANQETMSAGSRVLLDGARATGLDVRWMLKALGDCTGCGGCNIGCLWDHKRSALTTFIPWAERDGARVLPETTVQRILWKGGKVVGLEATSGPQGEPVRILARSVVVSGGAIGSPGLLLKSKIRVGGKVGRRASFNLGAALVSVFPRPLDAYDGDQMSIYVKGTGFSLEPVHNPPAATALMVPGWFADHGQLMRRYRNLTFGGALVGSEAVGRVVHSPFFGHEETRFRLPPGDLLNLKRGLRALAQAMFAAGAERVVLPTHDRRVMDSPRDLGLIDEAMQSPRQFGLGSSHPQGGCALSDDPAVGVVDGGFKVHGFENLFVCDASVFPSCMRLNPLDTILAMADYAAPRILARA